jgi:RNA polymerase sigma-70 factor (ECF subfamily)
LRSAGALDSEEILGEVFLRVTRRLGRFRGSDDELRRWVFTIAHNCLVDEQRRRHRQTWFVRTVAPTGASEPPPTEPFDAELVAALTQLTPEQREVVTLRFIADLAIEDVARITRRPTTAVKSLQHRALRTLAAALNRTSETNASAN